MNMTIQQTRSDAGLAVALRISVSRLARRLRAERVAGGVPELSETQFAALAALERHGTMSPGELAAHEKVQPPSMTRVIAALEERGLVARAPHPTDRRPVSVTVSATCRRSVGCGARATRPRSRLSGAPAAGSLAHDKAQGP